MARGILNTGSGAGVDSAEYTATAANVLSGKKYVGNDTNGEIGTGSMPNRGNVAVSLKCGESYTVPSGYHAGSGAVTANSLESQTPGNADAAHIQSGYSAWVNGAKVTGSLPYRGTNQYGTFVYSDTYCAIDQLPEGIYASEGNSWAPEARALMSQVASVLGITADKIRKGVTILGITGTWQGYV
jgi:hypothetical protein